MVVSPAYATRLLFGPVVSEAGTDISVVNRDVVQDVVLQGLGKIAQGGPKVCESRCVLEYHAAEDKPSAVK